MYQRIIGLFVNLLVYIVLRNMKIIKTTDLYVCVQEGMYVTD